MQSSEFHSLFYTTLIRYAFGGVNMGELECILPDELKNGAIASGIELSKRMACERSTWQMLLPISHLLEIGEHT